MPSHDIIDRLDLKLGKRSVAAKNATTSANGKTHQAERFRIGAASPAGSGYLSMQIIRSMADYQP